MSYRHNVRLDSNSCCSSKLFFLYSSGEDWRIVALLQRNEKVQSIGDVCDKQTRGVFRRYIEKNKNILYNFRQISL